VILPCFAFISWVIINGSQSLTDLPPSPHNVCIWSKLIRLMIGECFPDSSPGFAFLSWAIPTSYHICPFLHLIETN
jgi:hypothetical protein